MDKAMWDKLAAAGGIVGVAFFLIGLFILGEPPQTSHSAGEVVDFFLDNRDQVLWSLFLQGLGVLAVIWFIGALGAAMRDAGEGRLAAVMGIAFAIVVSIGAVAALVRGSLAFSIAEDGDASTVQSLYQMTGYMDNSSNLIGAGLYLAVGGAVIRTGLVVSWWGWLSTLAGLWAIVSSTAWNRDGSWTPDDVGVANFVVFLVWVLITSSLLTMKAVRATSTA